MSASGWPGPFEHSSKPLRELAEMPLEEARAINLLFCDIDDTITLDGRLPAIAYSALEALAESGVDVVPVTGRPAGWCDMIARFWPVRAVIGENGAFYFRHDHSARKVHRVYWRSAQERAFDRERLERIRVEVLREVPDSAIASDQAYREADLAVDFAEDVGPLPEADTKRIVEIFECHGAVAKVSSIHVNGWFGDYDKRRMCERYLHADHGLDLADAVRSAAFIGDSPNDEPMFGTFPCSIGVRNIERFIGDLHARPSYLTRGHGGLGFAELAELLVRSRT